MSLLSKIARLPALREYCWRIGRSLYLASRGEGNNALGSNSEGALVDMIVKARDLDVPASFIDIGGNLGDWTAMALEAAARSNRKVTVDVFEPAPKAFEALKGRFGKDANVRLHPLALSNEDGEAAFHITTPTGGRNSLVALADGTTEVIRVPVRKGADYLRGKGVSRIHLAKIDAEGHDMAVLEGLEPLLMERALDCVQFEYSCRWMESGRSMRDICALAERTDYKLANVVDGKLEIIPGWNPELDRFFEWNYVLVAPDVAHWLPHRSLRWTESNTLAR